MVKVCVLSEKFISSDLFWVTINPKNLKAIEIKEEQTVFKRKRVERESLGF